MRALTVSVDFGDLLAVTLPRNIRHFAEYFVISAPTDAETAAVARRYGAQLIQTDAFYRGPGAAFRKGLAIEEALEQTIGRRGTFVSLDADIVLPPDFALAEEQLRPDVLYGARRRVLRDPRKFADGLDWNTLPELPDKEIAGYFQAFRADSLVCRQVPWYGVQWLTAAGYDTEFERRWPEKHWLPFAVLHLGEDGKNWCGRATDRLDGRHDSRAARRRQQWQKLQQARKRHGFSKERADGAREF